MDPNTSSSAPKPGISKLKLAVGAASLFLFIVGLKRTFDMEDAPEGARAGSGDGGAPEREEPQETAHRGADAPSPGAGRPRHTR